MDTKLTLKLDKKIIEKAKIFARQNNISLSALVEKYFEVLTEKDHEKEPDLSPTVKALSGIIKIEHDAEPKDIRDRYLLEKYLGE